MLQKTGIIKHKTGLVGFIKREMVFSISLVLAVITSMVSVPKMGYINFKMIFSLFNLMVLVKAFEELKIMDMAAVRILGRFKDSRMVSLALIFLTFFSSMFLTNDVALLTFVPLTLVIGRKTHFSCMETVIFQTLAANIGSSLTPMGNPQNLFLFTRYNMSLTQFFSAVAPFVAMGMIFLVLLNLRIQVSDLKFNLIDIKIQNGKKAVMYGILFIIVILSVFNIIDYRIASILTILFTFINDKKLLKRVDFFLIMTFICFFIFIGNISGMEVVCTHIKAFLSSGARTYFTSIILSQFISNVPAAILLSGFTGNWKAVLLGVNIGGMGTLIASLASVISYKLYVNDYEDGSKYLFKFNIYNLSGLVLFTLLNYAALSL